MLSGIGPAEQLAQHNIPLIHELPLLGRKLQDHCYVPVGIVMNRSEAPPTNEPPSQSPNPMGWFKLSQVLNSEEFASLPREKQEFLQAPTTPTTEIVTVYFHFEPCRI
jgi:choline dehydrogenase-like flavoprotein